MRQLARLLNTINAGLPDSLVFKDYLNAEHFDSVVHATEELCGVLVTADGYRAFGTPSLALRLGHLLVKLADVRNGRCLREKDRIGKEDAEDFLTLHKSEWTDAIPCNARRTLKRKKDQQVNFLPLTDDLLKVRNFMLQEMKTPSDTVVSYTTYRTWRRLARVLMSRLILFNKRRGGEVSKLLLSTYVDRPDWKGATTVNAEIMAALQPLEVKLLDR